VDAPAHVLTKDDRDALTMHKAAVLALLRAEEQRTMTPSEGSWADNVRYGPCGLCGSQLAWVEDWPCAGEARWLCPSCAAWPAPSLTEAFAGLTADERQRLDTEVARGDHLAVVVLRELRGDRRAAS
jgi:hypothetical protein